MGKYSPRGMSVLARPEGQGGTIHNPESWIFPHILPNHCKCNNLFIIWPVQLCKERVHRTDKIRATTIGQYGRILPSCWPIRLQYFDNTGIVIIIAKTSYRSSNVNMHSVLLTNHSDTFCTDAKIVGPDKMVKM